MSAPVALPRDHPSAPISAVAAVALKALHQLISAPAIVFLAALTAMLFRPPDLQTFPADRVLFVVLVGVVLARLVVTEERLRIHPASWPMLALTLLAVRGLLTQSYQAQGWSMVAAKWIVPVALFHFAGQVFVDEASLRKFELFAVFTLTYLTAMAVFFLFDMKQAILPRYLLDEGIGIHADRARGPFLQAVANGVSITLLGLIALRSFELRRLPRALGAVLFVFLPLALLATRTRAVWLAAAVATVLITLSASSLRLRRVALGLCVVGCVGACILTALRNDSNSLTDRLQDRSPVDFRLDMYRAGWQMFLEKPIKGWGSEGRIQPEIARRIDDFHPDYYLFHNTYLELGVERGLIGLGLYAWLMVCFFRLSRMDGSGSNAGFLGGGFQRIWPILLIVYLLNASAVVMNYQFVNGLLFTIAGILSAQNLRAGAFRNAGFAETAQ